MIPYDHCTTYSSYSVLPLVEALLVLISCMSDSLLYDAGLFLPDGVLLSTPLPLDRFSRCVRVLIADSF